MDINLLMNKSAGYFALAIAAILGLGIALTLAPVQTAVTVHSTLTTDSTAMRAGDVITTVLDGQGGIQMSIDASTYLADGQVLIAADPSAVSVNGVVYNEDPATYGGVFMTDTAVTFSTAAIGGSAIVFDSSP
ncbi:MAG: hypothetical protein CMO12_03690 [Thaumarchaeota archaeon]|nr:hypothetical protein [Nitrososphaerota archaeon]